MIVVTAKSFAVDGQIVRVRIAIGRRSQIELNENKIQMTDASPELLDGDQTAGVRVVAVCVD